MNELALSYRAAAHNMFSAGMSFDEVNSALNNAEKAADGYIYASVVSDIIRKHS